MNKLPLFLILTAIFITAFSCPSIAADPYLSLFKSVGPINNEQVFCESVKKLNLKISSKRNNFYGKN